MQQFTDRHGVTRSIDLSVTSVRRLKQALGVDVYELVQDGMTGLDALLSDPYKLVDVLYFCCCGPGSPVTADEFGEGLAGDALADAGEAFARAVIDFFPDRAKRPVLTEMVKKANEIATHLAKDAADKIASIDPATLLEDLRKRLGNGAASSASTPDPSPGANSA